MPQLTIGLVQINDGLTWARRWRGFEFISGSLGKRAEPLDQDPDGDEYAIFPYSVGILQAYAQQHASIPNAFVFLTPLYKHLPEAQAAAYLDQADVIAFSIYVWNVNRSAAIARLVKSRRPNSLIIFGGPQVPDQAEDFLRENPFVDIVCHGEGEATFLRILESAQTRCWDDVPGVSYIDAAGEFVTHPRGSRLHELDLIPSPYLEGVFDPLMCEHPNEKWIMLWETNRGCPFSCAFCDWGSATASKVYQFDLYRLFAELEWYGKRRGEFIFCCDANFGILHRDYELAQAAAATKAQYGFPRSLSVQNTKNATERAYRVQKLLADAGMNTSVTLSLQSVDPVALRNVKRENIKPDHFERLQTAYTRDGVDTYSDMILALPGETYESFSSGVSRVIRGGQHNRILFYNLSILPNAEMGNPAYQALHGMVSISQRISMIHSSRDRSTGAAEYLRTVVATATMPAVDWRRAKAFWWMTDLLYFAKLLQLPIALIAHYQHIEHHAIIEAFLSAKSDQFPVTGSIVELFQSKAERIQNGEIEWIADDEWLRIHWPADQFAFIGLAASGKIEDFYREAHEIITSALIARGIAFDSKMVAESIELNRRLLRIPFASGMSRFETSSDLWSAYQGILHGQAVSLQEKPTQNIIDRGAAAWSSVGEWCEHVLFSYNKRGAYLHVPRVQIIDRTVGAIPALASATLGVERVHASARS